MPRLNNPAIDYWQRQGFEVVDVQQVEIGSDNTDRIYRLGNEDISPYTQKLLASKADGFLISGTGMPALAAMKLMNASGKPVVS